MMLLKLRNMKPWQFWFIDVGCMLTFAGAFYGGIYLVYAITRMCTR